MGPLQSVTLSFKPAEKPKSGSRFFLLHGERGAKFANGVLESLKPEETSLENGLYQSDTSGIMGKLGSLVVRRKSKVFGVDAETTLLNSSLLTSQLQTDQDVSEIVFGLRFSLNRTHVHTSDTPMTPANLLLHSVDETGKTKVVTAAPEELAILIAALFRMNEVSAYVSETRFLTGESDNPQVGTCAGVCMFGLSEAPFINLAMGVEEHPPIASFTIYSDSATSDLLTVMKLLNLLRKSGGSLSNPSEIITFLGLTGTLDHSLVNRLLEKLSIKTSLDASA
ncbi:MAG: hypothetical protein Q7S22_05830 [Candidatus Micrarchaeota archaeon]|nr:hypothetical protein [Candidatus Micrarchaeota archaeon]